MTSTILNTMALVLGILAALWLYDGRLWQAFLAVVLSIAFGYLGTRSYEDSVDKRMGDAGGHNG